MLKLILSLCFLFSSLSAPIAVNDNVSASDSGKVSLKIDLTKNDRDSSGRSFWIEKITQGPSKGYGWKDNGSYIYKLNEKYSGTIALKYRLRNDRGEVSPETTVSIKIGGGSPTLTQGKKLQANNDSFSESYSGDNFSENLNILGNDVDALIFGSMILR